LESWIPDGVGFEGRRDFMDWFRREPSTLCSVAIIGINLSEVSYTEST